MGASVFWSIRWKYCDVYYYVQIIGDNLKTCSTSSSHNIVYRQSPRIAVPLVLLVSTIQFYTKILSIMSAWSLYYSLATPTYRSLTLVLVISLIKLEKSKSTLYAFGPSPGLRASGPLVELFFATDPESQEFQSRSRLFFIVISFLTRILHYWSNFHLIVWLKLFNDIQYYQYWIESKRSEAKWYWFERNNNWLISFDWCCDCDADDSIILISSFLCLSPVFYFSGDGLLGYCHGAIFSWF